MKLFANSADDAVDFFECGATGYDVENAVLEHGTHATGHGRCFDVLGGNNIGVSFEKFADFAGHLELFANSYLTLEAKWVFFGAAGFVQLKVG